MNQGDSGRRVNPPPDVIFAQKATAIVKAAGMDPRSIDLEKFRLNASLVFSRAYSAIYKEKLLTVLNENSSKEDKILNSQLVLDGLFTKTRNPILLQLTGNDLYQGNHRAIGVLVGILFAEGQRLWLEKIKSTQELPIAPVGDSLDAEQDMRLQSAQDVLSQNDEDTNAMNEEDLEESNGYGGNEIRESLKTLHKMRSNPQIGAVDLERLLSRISFLEEQLQHKNSRKKHNSGKKVQKRRIEKRISEAILQDNEINQRRPGLFDNDSQEDAPLHTTQSSPRSGTADRKEYKRAGESRSPSRRPVSSGAVGVAERRKTRPTSAPSTSHRKIKSIRHPSNRLYSAALSKKELELEKTNPNGSGRNNNNNSSEPKDIFDPAIHTYDWRSGRKILLSQAQVEYEERKRSKEAMGNILAISENDVDTLMGGGGGGGGGGVRDGSPTKAEYPSKSISGDVDKWLQRMRRERYGESKSTSKMEDLPLPEPRYFAAYQKMEDRDLIITIEHCHNCQHHNVTTRHKEEEYVNHSSTFLRVLAQIAHECGVCARVGVGRIKANVTPKCSTSDQDSRIGAFEIQIAYKQPNGKVVPVLLHSKLTTRRWPSKSVLEKRFRAFVAKAKVSTSGGDSSDGRSGNNARMATDSAEPYPVGSCHWALSPVANPAWSFALIEAAAAAPSASSTAGASTGASVPFAAGTFASPATNAPPAAAATSSIPSVQWAFDLRELSDAPPKFAIGSTIRVHQLNYAPNCTERHALLAVVKEYVDPEDPHSSDVIVKPMYHVQEVKVPQRNCVNLSSYTDRMTEYSPEEVPIELQVLILLAKRNNLISWDFSGGNGRKESNGDICLSRKAFYTQVRKLSWAAEKKLAGGRGKFLLAHPTTGEEVDTQLSYSEEVINWVFETFKGEGNVTALEKMVIPPPKAPGAKPTAPAAAVTQTSIDPTPRSEKAASSTARTGVSESASTSASAARPAPADASARTPTLSASGSADKQQEKEGGSHSSVQQQQQSPLHTEEPLAQVSALTVESSSPEQAETGRDISQAEASGVEQQEPDMTVPTGGDESTPPLAAVAVEAPASDEVPHTEQADVSQRKPSAAPPKRFSSASLVSAVDAALKSKIIAALTYPGCEHDPGMSAMERMGLLNQLSDAVFEEAVLESDERAELPQASFLVLLENFGLRTLLNNQSFAETVLLKAQTSSNTPEMPVKVEAFMHWLQSGETNNNRRQGPTKSSKEETPSPAIDAATAEEPIPVAVHESTVKNEQAAEAQAPSSSRSARSEKHSDEAASAPASARTAAPVAVADNAGSTEELQQPPPSQRSVKSTPREQEPTSTAAASPRSSSGADSAGPSGAAAAPAAADPPSSARSNPAATSAGAGSGSAKNTGRESARESAKDSARETVRESARDSARDSSKIPPRGELTARTGSAKSVTNPATVATARSTASVEDKDTAEKKQEEYRLSLDYQPKELQISSIIIEGDQLVHANYDTVLVNVRIGSTEWLATTCMAREKGSKRRSYNVKWPELLVSADAFRNDSAIVTVAISDNAVAAANPVMPSLSTTQFGESPNSVSVPLYLLMQPSFDVVKEVRVEPIVAQKKGGPASSGVVKIFLHGNARDPKGLRTARIMSMRPQDLMNIKFDPILPLDDAEDLYESDEEEESVSSAPRSRGRKPGTIPESPQEMEDEELTRTLYPKASMANFSMANTAASVPAGAGAGVGGGVSNVMSQAASVETL